VSVLILTSVEIDEKLSWVEVGSGGCLPPSRSFVNHHCLAAVWKSSWYELIPRSRSAAE
jgi:hypothetical protein